MSTATQSRVYSIRPERYTVANPLHKFLDYRRARRVARLLREMADLRRGCEQLSATTDSGDCVRRDALRRRMVEVLEEIREAEAPIFGELVGPGVKMAMVRGGPYLTTWAVHCPRCRVTLLPADTTDGGGAVVHRACGVEVERGTKEWGCWVPGLGWRTLR